MPSLALRDIPQPLYEQLRTRADLNRRSMNAEILVILERALASRRASAAELLERIGRTREGIEGPLLSDAFLADAKRSGRP